MRLIPMSPLPPGDPLQHDPVSMGQKVHTNLEILTLVFPSEEADEVVLVDPRTGERHRLILNENGVAEDDPEPFVMREAKSPVGPQRLTCKPCAHSWADHDDHGCLWHTCQCSLPGERK